MLTCLSAGQVQQSSDTLRYFVLVSVERRMIEYVWISIVHSPGSGYSFCWFIRCIPLVNALFLRSRLPLELMHEVVAIRRIIAIVILTFDISVLGLSSLRIPTKTIDV